MIPTTAKDYLDLTWYTIYRNYFYKEHTTKIKRFFN